MLLAIDTSTELSGLALYDAQGVHAEATWRSARHHTEQLVAQLDLMTQQLSITPAALSAVAVALGPGSWAGLRVGISLAKAIAVARSLPIIGVTTMEVLAWSHRQSAEPVITVVRLGRERYVLSTFDPLTPPCAPVSAMQVYQLADVPRRAGLYVGDLDPVLRQHLAAHGRFASPADNVRRPAALAELAWTRLEQNDVDDLVALEPIYLSSPIKTNGEAGLA